MMMGLISLYVMLSRTQKQLAKTQTFDLADLSRPPGPFSDTASRHNSMDYGPPPNFSIVKHEVIGPQHSKDLKVES